MMAVAVLVMVNDDGDDTEDDNGHSDVDNEDDNDDKDEDEDGDVLSTFVYCDTDSLRGISWRTGMHLGSQWRPQAGLQRSFLHWDVVLRYGRRFRRIN